MRILFIVPWLDAGINSGNALAKADNNMSVIRCEVSTLPPATPL